MSRPVARPVAEPTMPTMPTMPVDRVGTAAGARPRGLPGLPQLDRCLVFGILNVTPDSFSDGGRWVGAPAAVRQGLALRAAGADVVDIGGESTRPGAARVSEDEEVARVLPVVEALTADGVLVSIDTMRAAVARAAVEAGAVLVNDVSGGLADPAMAQVVARSGVAYVLMHWRGHSETMRDLAVYSDVVGEVRDELAARLDAMVAAGVDPGQVVLDPGIGFAKTAGHDWALLGALPELAVLGRPLLVGASRKSFLGRLLADEAGEPRPTGGREAATTALTALAAAGGAWAVRVHDPGPSADAVRVVAAVRTAQQEAGR